MSVVHPRYISALLLSLSTMVHLELPHINVLSKMDLVKLYGDMSKDIWDPLPGLTEFCICGSSVKLTKVTLFL